MKPPERYETNRLTLRPPKPEDAESIFQNYAKDRLVTRFLTWEHHETISDTHKFIKRCRQVWLAGTAFPWVLCLKETGEVIGMIELKISGHRAELGYVLARDYWEKGLATEAASLIVDWAIAQPSIFRVWAVCDVDNLGSARALEKARMRREGILRRWLFHPNLDREPRDCYAYSVTK